MMAAPATRRNPQLVVQTLARCLMHPAVRTLPSVRPFSAATANPTAKDYLKDYEFPKAWPFQSEHFRWSSCMPCIWQIRVAPANVLLACVARRHKTRVAVAVALSTVTSAAHAFLSVVGSRMDESDDASFYDEPRHPLRPLTHHVPLDCQLTAWWTDWSITSMTGRGQH